MKIAFVEWWPRICGATDWLVHLSAGAAPLGHTAELVTFSASGRWLSAWPKNHPWTVYRQRDAVEVLNGFDLIITSDIAARNPAWKNTMPYYAEVLAMTRTPYTTMLHDGAYEPALDPVMDAFLAEPSFVGRVLTTRYEDVAPRFPNMKTDQFRIDRFLPYAPPAVQAPVSRRKRAVIMTGRLTSNKGQDVAAMILPPVGIPVDFRGYNSFGLPSTAWAIYELLIKNGYAEIMHPKVRAANANLTHPNAKKFYTGAWELAAHDTVAGTRVRYLDGFDELSEERWDHAVHLSLTNAKLRGTLEYATLDGIALGCVPIVPEHAIEFTEGAYGTALTTVPYRGRRLAKGELKVDGDPSKIVATIKAMVRAPQDELAKHHDRAFSMVRQLHAPERVLRDFLTGIAARSRPKSVHQQRPKETPMAPKEPTRGVPATNRAAIARLIETAFLARFVKASSTVLDLGGDGSFGRALAELPTKSPHVYFVIGPKASEIDFTWATTRRAKNPLSDALGEEFSVVVADATNANANRLATFVRGHLTADGTAIILGTTQQLAEGKLELELARAGMKVVEQFGIGADPAGIPSELPPAEKVLMKKLAAVWPADLIGSAFAALHPELALRVAWVVKIGSADATASTPFANTKRPPKEMETSVFPPQKRRGKKEEPSAESGLHSGSSATPAPRPEKVRRKAKAEEPVQTSIPGTEKKPRATAKAKAVLPGGAPPKTSKEYITQRLTQDKFLPPMKPPKDWADRVATEVREVFPGRTTKASDVYYVWRKLGGI